MKKNINKRYKKVSSNEQLLITFFAFFDFLKTLVGLYHPYHPEERNVDECWSEQSFTLLPENNYSCLRL